MMDWPKQNSACGASKKHGRVCEIWNKTKSDVHKIRVQYREL
ncbi:hypothetical protein VCRA2123O13_20251 [Vibrio crassostreae]|nr:hypothetical protein VCRA2110O4_30238 [Vibrio crassostreae]CAK3510499.1 hypothetical protein VCRA2120O9_40044 [Vibrio crassostreae]CAK3539346.1 hypothetical protein VCRA2123O13_20251 [Vibrio crassostreae]CAK3589085.1 hypothetical protein VCRA2126E14_40044 [Vibrio crassostreae]